MSDSLRAGIPPRYVTKPTRSTQPCIPLGSLNRVPALIVWGNGGNITSAGWQVTLCDPIWHVSSRSGAVLVAQTAIAYTLPSSPYVLSPLVYTRSIINTAFQILLGWQFLQAKLSHWVNKYSTTGRFTVTFFIKPENRNRGRTAWLRDARNKLYIYTQWRGARVAWHIRNELFSIGSIHRYERSDHRWTVEILEASANHGVVNTWRHRDVITKRRLPLAAATLYGTRK